MNSLFSILGIDVLSRLIATTLGFLGAYSLVRGRYGSKKLIISFCLLPLIIPTIITSVALYFVSVPLDLVGSKVWIAICHAALAIPVVLLILVSSLQGIDVSIEIGRASVREEVCQYVLMSVGGVSLKKKQ